MITKTTMNKMKTDLKEVKEDIDIDVKLILTTLMMPMKVTLSTKNTMVKKKRNMMSKQNHPVAMVTEEVQFIINLNI